MPAPASEKIKADYSNLDKDTLSSSTDDESSDTASPESSFESEDETHEELSAEDLERLSSDDQNKVVELSNLVSKNEGNQNTLLNQRELINKNLTRNKIQQKQKKWFNRDAAAGTIAAGAIVALYSGVEKVRNFLPPGTANLIMPFFIVADILTTVASWKSAFLSRKLNQEKNAAAGRSSWIGSRNPLLRAIFETGWAALGTATVLGAIITSTFLATAAATAFAVVIAPFFMVVLGTRTLFNAISSVFHVVRAHLTDKKAQAEIDPIKKNELTNQAAGYRRVAVIQAGAAAASAIGFIATTVVMLTHHFSFSFIGVGGGLALGGLMAYIFHGNSKWSSALKTENTNLLKESKSVEKKLDKLETKQHENVSKLGTVLKAITSIGKKTVSFMLPVSVPPVPAAIELKTVPSTTAATTEALAAATQDAEKTAKQPKPHYRRIHAHLPDENGVTPMVTRFGIYATKTAAKEAQEANRPAAPKQRKMAG